MRLDIFFTKHKPGTIYLISHRAGVTFQDQQRITSSTHCSLLRCLISDLQGRDRFNEMAQFCNQCKSVFNRKGWAF